MNLSGADLDRFWNKVDRLSGECWVWTGGVNNYGRFYCHGKMHLAHRVAYEVQVGPIPEDMTIDHECRNRLCVRAAHLHVCTLAENISRMPRRGRDLILRLREEKPEMTYKDLAVASGTTYSNVWAICKNADRRMGQGLPRNPSWFGDAA